MTNNDINPVGSIKHNAEKRASIPTSEQAGDEAMVAADLSAEGRYRTFKHEFTRGRDPEIYWLGKYSNDDDDTKSPDLKVDTRSLYVHEDIQPEMLINKLYTLREENTMPKLFGDDELPNKYQDELKRITEYYQHNAEWKNRLIQGDSLLVMNSLLQREGMAGKVQCVYIDPPYGIKYGSNWQMKLNNREVKDKDENVSGEPEMIKAFRDTWELGIHSYLSYLRDRLVCARELLNETGSCFVQISDDNVHLVRNLMDEVFGSDNFVSQIVYVKTTGAGSPGELLAPPAVNDYIVWYAKCKDTLKFRKLSLPKTTDGVTINTYKNIELEDGQRMSIADWEKLNKKKLDYKEIPKNARLFKLSVLYSESGGENSRFPVEFEGKTYTLKTGSWKTGEEGMKRLIKQNRIMSSGTTLNYVRYFDDYLRIALTNLWPYTSVGSNKLYIVQSSITPIQRCILMTTDPGDLILDPTCGSGTTAYVAEQWGRRWITIDTSRIALNIAKKRLITAVFPYYKLFDTEGGNVRQGFIYKTVSHLQLKHIANDLPADEEILYDQPEEDKKKIRVAGPFTVETLQSFNVVDPATLDRSDVEETLAFQERIFAHLKASGIRNGAKNEQAVFYNVEAVANPYINAKGYYKDANGTERLAYFHIGPKFGTVSKLAVSMALQEFRPKAMNEGASWLVILGFSFEDNINEADYRLGTFTVSKVRMHDDLMQDGLLKKDKGAGSFITIGEPDIALVDDEGGDTCHVEIRGLDIYDPIKDIVKPRSVEDIAYWEIDDNYDGQQFVVRGMYFCGGDKKEFEVWRKGLQSAAPGKAKKKAEKTLKLEFNDELWDCLYSHTSAPIKKEKGRKVAVRVISQFGEESSKVLEMK